MCFNRQLSEGVAQVAQQDIYAFKILKKVSSGLRSPSQYAEWKVNDLKREPNFERIATTSINVGLHCLKTYKDAVAYNESTFLYCNYKIYPVKIPKGSLYWENGTQYCSDQMILISNRAYLKNGQLSKAKK